MLVTLLSVGAATSAGAAGGDVFDRGKRWCATTHPNHGTLEGFGPALDLGSPTDFRWPVYAPGAGRVRIHSTGWGGGWGRSIIWISANGRERIHFAHLDSFGATGGVRAGRLIGKVGMTGEATSPHLHASARRDGKPARLILGGRRLEAGGCYTSRGPIPPKCLGREATLVGTNGNDVLLGTAGDDVIVGRGGADRIEGRGGRDLLCGGRGADRVLGGRGEDGLAGGRADDHLEGGEGSDRASYAGASAGVSVDLGLGTATGHGTDSLAGIEDVEGSSFGDVLTGDGGPNRLLGLPGDDTLDGGEGEDVADGGEGTDACGAETALNCEDV